MYSAIRRLFNLFRSEKQVDELRKRRRIFFEPLEARHLLTTVSIVALDDSAAEPTSQSTPPGQVNTGTFRVSRSTDEVGRAYFALTDLGVAYPVDMYDFSYSSNVFIDPYNLQYYVQFGEYDDAVTVTITPLYDEVQEETETARFEILEHFSYEISGDNQADVLIADNGYEGAPTVTIVATDPDASEAGNNDTGELRVERMTSNLSSPLTVSFTAGGTATSGADYNSIGTSVTIPAGQASTTIDIVAIEDSDPESPETVIVTLGSGTGYEIGSPSSATVTIRDDSLPYVSITPVVSGDEESTIVFYVQLSYAHNQTVTVDYASSNGTTNSGAIAGTDYTAVQGTLTFAPNELQKTISVQTLSDSLDELDEQLYVTLSNPMNAVILHNGVVDGGIGRGIILDNDGPTISINDKTATEAGGLAFTVSLSSSSVQTVTVDYRTENGTAVHTADYTRILPRTLTFNPGDTSKQITVQSLHDLLDEYNETFAVVLSNADNATIARPEGTGTITDDDPTPSVSVEPISVIENVPYVDVVVRLSAVSGRDVIVSYATANGTAVAGNDYTSASGSVTILAGNQTGTIRVNLRHDEVDEDNEYFVVTLSNPNNAVNGTMSANVTIVDDDPPPKLRIADVTVNEDVGLAVFVVTLVGATSKQVYVDYVTADATATDPEDYYSTYGTLDFAPGQYGQTVYVSIRDDNADEDSQTFYVNLSNQINADIQDGQAVGTIHDNDGPEISITNAYLTEGNSTVKLQLSLSYATVQEVSVSWATASGSATSPQDYTAASGTVTFPPHQTNAEIHVTIKEDARDEPLENFFVNLSSEVHATISDRQAEVSIEDNDPLPKLKIYEAQRLEDDANMEFTVRLEPESGREVTVHWAATPDSATSPDDFTATSGSLTFGPGTTEQTIHVPIKEDSIDEESQRFYVTLSDQTYAEFQPGGNIASGTILDDDGPTISIQGPFFNVPEVHQATATFVVRLSETSVQEVLVRAKTINDTATSGHDFQIFDETLVFEPGQYEKQITVSVLHDLTDEIDEKFYVELSNAENGSILHGFGKAPAWIDDNDGPDVSVADAQGVEGGGWIHFTVSVSALSPQPITVEFETSDFDAISPDDYLSDSGQVTIPANTWSQTFSIELEDDEIDEVDQWFFVSLSNPRDAELGDWIGIGTIDDDDGPAISIADKQATESVGQMSFVVSLSAASPQDIKVNYSTQPGTAHAERDFRSESGQVTIPAGQLIGAITIPIINDGIDENDETFSVNLSAPVDATIADGTAEGTIHDNDDPPRLSINDVQVEEDGDEVNFTVSLSEESEKTVSVVYETVEATATSPEDYLVASDTLVFTPGTTSKQVTVEIVDDVIAEGFDASFLEEYFLVELKFPVNATIADGTGRGMILDNEPRILIEAVDSLSAETANNSAPGRFRVTRTGEFLFDTEVIIEVSGTAGNGADYEWISDLIYVGTDPVYIDVLPINDSAREAVESVTLVVQPSSDQSYSIHPVFSAATVTIADNDHWQVGIEASKPNAFENDTAPGKVKFTRSGETDTTFPLTVHFSVDPQSTATDNEDFQLSEYSQIEIPAGALSVTVDVTPVNDDVIEGDESVIVRLEPCPDDEYTMSSPATATVTIEDDDKPSTQPRRCPCVCPIGSCRVNQSTGTLTASVGAHRTSNLNSPAATMSGNSSSDGNPHPIVSVDVQFSEQVLEATKIEAKLTFGGIVGQSVFYSTASLTADTPYHFALQADATTLASGSYNWQLAITEHYESEPDVTRTYNGRMEVQNRINSEFGNRWGLTGLDRVKLEQGGLALIQGNGNAFWFREVFPGIYERESGELGYTEAYIDLSENEFVFTSKSGDVAKYNSQGLLKKRIDSLGNTFTYAYIDGDGDGAVDELASITDPTGLVTTYAYTAGRLSSVTDFAGRVTTYAYDTASRLTTVTNPDPDGTGPLTSQVNQFGYDAVTGLMTSMTDPDGFTTSFEYHPDRTLKKRTLPGGATEEFSSSVNAGVVDTSAGLGSDANPAPLLATSNVQGRYKDPLGNISYFKSDRFGDNTVEIDAQGNVTLYERDGEGRVTKITAPDPDGAGPLPSPITQYSYDAKGNVLQITHPDASTERWEYEPFYNKPTKYTDRRGNVTHYTVGGGGLVDSVRQVIGQFDGENGNQEDDDVMKYFTYTLLPNFQEDPPAGLLETVTDPLGRVTRFEYDQRGNLTRTIFAEGLPDEADVEMEYDSANRMIEYTDELGRVTTFEYDNLDRLIRKTLPDPDNGGPLAAPVYQTEYNKRNLVSKEIDPLGRETVYSYNGRGDLISVTRPDHDGDGNLTVSTLSYNLASLVTGATDALGQITTFVYDTLNRQTSATLPDPDGAGPIASPVLQTVYDNLGRTKQSIDALLNTTSFSYLNFGQQITTTLPDPDGTGPLSSPTGTVVYDAVGNLVSSTDALGRVTTYTYDALNRLTSVTQPDPDPADTLPAPVTTYAYDKASNLLSVTDSLGNVTFYEYDDRYRMVRMIQPDPDGVGPHPTPITRYEYDDANQLTRVIDPLNRITVYAYDNLGRQTTITRPDPDGAGPLTAPVTTFGYDVASRLTSLIDPLGNVTGYAYDLHDNLISVTKPDPDGIGPQTAPITAFTYDAAGQLLTTTDPMGRVSTTEYDNLGRTTKVWQPDPDGAGPLSRPLTTYAYDLAGNLTSVSDPLSHVTSYTYDNLYRRKTITDANTGITSFTYDAVGNLLSLKDPVNNTTSWTYDGLNRATQETNQLGHSRSFVYDAIGNLTKKTDRNGRVTEYSYDNLYRLKSEAWKQGTATLRTLSYSYDAASQLLTASDPAASYTYVYDSLGRVASETQSISGLSPAIIYQSKYDALDRRTELQAILGGTADFKNTYAYDNLSRVTHINQQGTAGGNAVAAKRVDFEYDASGLTTKINRYADIAGFEYVASSHSSYDGLGRLTKLIHSTSPTAPLSGWGVPDPLAGYQYAYDSASRITSIDSFLDGLSTYTHDNTNQLTGADHASQTDETYGYDLNGNRNTPGYTTGPNNRLLSDGTYNYTYDNEGNRLTKTNIATGEREEYTWDYRNRLIKVTFKNSSGTVIKTVDQTYDIYNQWIKRSVDPDGAIGSAAIQDTYFSHEDGQIALQFDGNLASDLTNRYLWGEAVDQLLADEKVSSLFTAGNVLWALTDHLETVRDLADRDESAGLTAVTNHRRYDSYGNLISESNAAVDTLFGFTGRALDDATSFQNNLNRWYDASAGRWLNEDPIGFAAGDINLARYVGNQILVSVDPTGLIDLASIVRTLSPTPSRYTDALANSFNGTSLEEPAQWGASIFRATDGGRMMQDNGINAVARPFEAIGRAYENSQNGQNPLLAFGKESMQYGIDSFDGFAGNPVGMLCTQAKTLQECHAGTERGLSPLESSALTAWERAPVINLTHRFGESAVGERLGGSDHGELMSANEIRDNYTTGVRDTAMLYFGVRSGLPGRVMGRSNAQLVQEVGTRAEAWGVRKGITGTPQDIGRAKHGYADRLLTRYQQRYGDRGLKTEVRYINGKPWQQGIDPLKGSIRLDVVEGPLNNPTWVWDYKFGSAGLTPSRIKEIRTGAGLGPNVPVDMVRP